MSGVSFITYVLILNVVVSCVLEDSGFLILILPVKVEEWEL